MIRFPSMLGLLVLLCATAQAYETTTHSYVTNEAFNRSVLADTSATSVFVRLGFDRLDAARPFQSPFANVFDPSEGAVFTGQGYWDLVPQGGGFNLIARDPYTPFEQRLTNELLANNRLPGFTQGVDGLFVYRMQGWMARGSIREDDLALSLKDDYDNDSLGNFFRVFSHFYDPVHNVGLGAIAGASTCTTLQPCLRAVDWATGLVDALAIPSSYDTQSRNHYSWESAREAEFRALTSRRDHNSNSLYEASDAQADSDERYYMWSTTFRALGDVVHLIQDMAQPQHTRQDIHSPFVTSAARQTFEAFTDLRVIRDFSPQNQTKSILRQIDGGFPSQGYVQQPYLGSGPTAYPTVSFATPREYFSDQKANLPSGYSPSTTELLGRRGMADFSDRTFFTEGTPPSVFSSYPLPPNDLNDTGYSMQPTSGTLWVNNQKVFYTQLTRAVTDPTAPSYVDAVSQNYSGKVPLLTAGSWFDYSLLYSHIETAFSVDLYNFTVMADVLLPRAVAYSTGAINYFFRGKLAVTFPPDRVVAVLNQGAQHTMNAQGYPCVGTASNDGCPIFGFQSIRVSVQNVTSPITESGNGAVAAQKMSATAVGDISDPNFHGPYLVAVARYHRNSCYEPNMSGERAQSYASPPLLTIADPSCTGGQTVRTPNQEISVSKSFAATAAQLAPNATAFEAHFDFSAEPIPVNATDLFIQVVYRGPMGDPTFPGDSSIGQEPDAIAVGTLDVREPTFVSYWNNTDWFWNESNWLSHDSLYPNEGARDFWVCAGGAPVKLVYEYYRGPTTIGAMDDPISASNVPGQVRLGIVYPPPEFVGQGKNARGVPVTYPGIPGTKQIPYRSPYVGSGRFVQANKENVAAATLAAPYPSSAGGSCGTGLPSTSEYWCSDPIQKRRGQLFGTPAQPLYLEPLGGSTPPTDVDAVPLPAFAGTVPLAQGTIRFDTDTTLVGCPTQPPQTLPTPASANAEADALRTIELLEEARNLGVSGEADPMQ